MWFLVSGGRVPLGVWEVRVRRFFVLRDRPFLGNGMVGFAGTVLAVSSVHAFPADVV